MLKFAFATIAVALISQNSFALECYGNEPFWAAKLTDKTLELKEVHKSTEKRISKITNAEGYTEKFLQVYSNRRGPVAVVKTASCSDGMSDNTYPQEIIIFDGKTTLYGCCGEPVPVKQK